LALDRLELRAGDRHECLPKQPTSLDTGGPTHERPA
jgi:hypothetical protein